MTKVVLRNLKKLIRKNDSMEFEEEKEKIFENIQLIFYQL